MQNGVAIGDGVVVRPNDEHENQAPVGLSYEGMSEFEILQKKGVVFILVHFHGGTQYFPTQPNDARAIAHDLWRVADEAEGK